MERDILHCDANGFYASVELLFNPQFKDNPVVVGGNEENRHGIVLAKNEVAKKYNIKTGEPLAFARNKCKDLVVLPPHHDLYAAYCDMINEIYLRYTDLVEPFGIDESWLDITNSKQLFGGDPKEIADKIRAEVYRELGLTVSVGVSFNKIFAKLGSDMKKPDATTVITKGDYKDKIYGLPVSDLIFVGKAVNEFLSKCEIKTIGELAAADRVFLERALGKVGVTLSINARGEDSSPVNSYYKENVPKTVGNGLTFRRNLVNLGEISSGLTHLCDSVASRLRKKKLRATGVAVSVKFFDFSHISKQRSLKTSTDLAKVIYGEALSLTKECCGGKAIRALTVTAINLVDSDNMGQLSFLEPLQNTKKQEQLENAMDKIRDKYGKGSIKLANTVDTNLGIDFDKDYD